MASLRRAEACRNVSRPSGVRAIARASAPSAVLPPCFGVAVLVPASAVLILSRTFTGLVAPARPPRPAPRSSPRRTRTRSAAPIPRDGLYPARRDLHPQRVRSPRARSDGPFPSPGSSTAAAFAPARRRRPACAPGGGAANVTVPQHEHARPGSAHSVTFRATSTSMTCAQRGPAASVPASPVPQRRHSAGGLRVLPLIRLRIPGQAVALVTGLPAPPAVLPPSRPTAAAPVAPFAPIRSFDEGVPDRYCPSAGAPAPPAAAPAAAAASVRPPARPQRLDLRGPRCRHGPQPRVGSAKPRGIIRHGVIGHAPQAPTPAATRQIGKRRNQPARGRPV